MPRILYIVPADYEALKAKGVDGMIFERDEGGFFDRVVTVHPIAYRNRIIEFNKVFVLHELNIDIFGRLSRSRLLRALFSPLHFARVVITTCKLVRRERIDLIRANDPFWMGLVGLIVAKLTTRPLCVSIHADYDKRQQLTGGGDTFTLFGMQWPARLVCRLVLLSTDRVLPIRESLGRWAVANGASPERIRVIPHGIDTKTLDADSHSDLWTMFDIPGDRKIISFVGRLSPENYLSDVLEMARILAAHRDDFCLVIAGGGELEDWLKRQLTADPLLSGVVRLIGFRPRTLCFALRCQSAVSLCLMGGFSLIEACAAGRPVVSYDVEWHHELVKNKETGFLVKEHDIDSLVEVVSELLDNPDKADRMGGNAQKLAFEKHNIKTTSEIKKTAYKELIDCST